MDPKQLQAFIIPVAFLVIFYLFIIRPQKKREKSINEMRSSLSVGDKIVTIGGIVGKISKIKEDELVIEVGPDKIRMTFKKWAIGTSEKKESSKEEVKEETKEIESDSKKDEE